MCCKCRHIIKCCVYDVHVHVRICRMSLCTRAESSNGIQLLSHRKRTQSSNEPLTTGVTNPIFLEMSTTSETEACHSIARRNSYTLATENDESSFDTKSSDSASAATAPGQGSSSDGCAADGEKKEKRKAINFFRAILIPGVIVVSIRIHFIHVHLLLGGNAKPIEPRIS